MECTGRNKYDVAMELLKMHIEQDYKLGEVVPANELENLFSAYYKLADRLPHES